MLSVVKLLQVNGEPLVKLDLPSVKIGDPVAFKFRLERNNAGRFEVLYVSQRFRVMAIALDASSWPARQVLSVEPADGKPPTWKSVKRPPQGKRRLSPAINPPTIV